MGQWRIGGRSPLTVAGAVTDLAAVAYTTPYSLFTRPRLWPATRAAAIARATLPYCDLFLPSIDEARLLFGWVDPERLADWALTAGSAIPPIIFGVAFGNLLLGVPFHFDELLRIYYTGSFWALLNPFALLVGVLSLLMFINQGACYLQMKTEAPLRQRSEAVSLISATLAAVLFVPLQPKPAINLLAGKTQYV
mgnify:CR=1 FL=1